MLFDTLKKEIVVGNPEIGEVTLTSYKYITVPEAKFIQDFQLLHEPVKVEILEYAKQVGSKLKIPQGDITDAFYFNTTNANEIRKKLVEYDLDLYNSKLNKLQKINDQSSTLKPYAMLKFRTNEEVKEKIKAFLPEDLLITGKVCTKALVIELIHFYNCEADGIDYFPTNKNTDKDDSENFT